MGKKYDVVYARNYTQNGEEKTHWINCGAVIETAKGFSLKLETIPVGFNGWFSLFEPKAKEEKPAKSAPPSDGFEDSQIPF